MGPKLLKRIPQLAGPSCCRQMASVLLLICRHNHQHNLSTGLTAEEVAKLPPRRHRNVKTVGKEAIASIWRESILGYLSADIICLEKRTGFRGRSARKTLSFRLSGTENVQGQISVDVFAPNGRCCVCYPSAWFLNLGNVTRVFPSFSWGIIIHVTRLDESRESGNIGWNITINMQFLINILDHPAERIKNVLLSLLAS